MNTALSINAWVYICIQLLSTHEYTGYFRSNLSYIHFLCRSGTTVWWHVESPIPPPVESSGVEWSLVEWSKVEWSLVEWSGVELDQCTSGVHGVECSIVKWSGAVDHPCDTRSKLTKASSLFNDHHPSNSDLFQLAMSIVMSMIFHSTSQSNPHQSFRGVFF